MVYQEREFIVFYLLSIDSLTYILVIP